jgi:hypothetical protein
MAPLRWKVSDWKNARLEPYRLLVKSATVFRGDGTPIDSDLQLGNLRDTYYEDANGPLKPTGGEDKADKVTRLSERGKSTLVTMLAQGLTSCPLRSWRNRRKERLSLTMAATHQRNRASLETI